MNVGAFQESEPLVLLALLGALALSWAVDNPMTLRKFLAPATLLPLLSGSILFVPCTAEWQLLYLLLYLFVNLDPGCRHRGSFLFKVTAENRRLILVSERVSTS